MSRFLVSLLLLSGPAFAQTDALRARVDSLFIRASSGLLKYRDLEEPSKKALREMPAAIPYLVEKMTIRDARERRELINILGKMPEALLPVCSAATDTNKDIVKTACEILVMLRDTVKQGQAATPYLLKARLHPEMQARGYAVIALGKWGGEGAREALQEALSDSVNFVRAQAAAALGYLNDTTAMPNLISALDDEYYGVRFVAANSLAKFKSASLPYLYRALESEKPMVRRLAAEALGRQKAPDAVTALFRLLKSADWADRLAAIEALAEVNSPEARKLLSSHVEEEPLVKARMEELLQK
jgi:HEAT repeat protein